ncbi:MAG TPA: ABC transporter substrate-binding protein [Stellaceae bacterium]|nr:ABC transporter substrate-binding protein [Stellaceae bacterium]
MERLWSSPSRVLRCAAVVLACIAAPGLRAAEPIKIGLVKTLAVGPIFVAQEEGFFAAEGLDAEIVFIDSAEPIAVAAASGAVDFGITGLSAGFYNLAAQGAVKIIAAGNREMLGFKNAGYVASNRAWDAGLNALEKLGGHSVAVTQRGGMLDYDLALAIERYKIDPASVRVLAVQSNTNMNSTIAGGQADAGVFPVTPAMVLLGKGEGKLLGWVGDMVPYGQANAAFTATKTANDRRATVEAFLRAYKKGARAYHDAFAGDDEERRDGPTAPAILDILHKYTGQAPAQIAQAIPWVDRDARLDVADIRHQVEWFRAQGLIKGGAGDADPIDERYVVPLPRK